MYNISDKNVARFIWNVVTIKAYLLAFMTSDSSMFVWQLGIVLHTRDGGIL